MRILYSLPHPSDRLAGARAGHIVRANALLDAMGRLGHEVESVEAATAPGAASASRAYRGLVKNRLPRPLALTLRDAGRFVLSHRAGRRLARAARAFRPDLMLETHTAFSLAGAIAATATAVPLVLDDVAPAWEESQQYGVGLPWLAARTYRRVTSAAALLVAVTEEIRDHLVAAGIDGDRIVMIENGIDPSRFHPAVDGRSHRAALGLSDETIAIVYVGSFQPFHGVPFLLEAFARAAAAGGPAMHLVLVGDGRTAGECRALVDRLDIRHKVIFTGAVAYAEVPALVAAADLAVIPASNDYGNSMKLYEYMAVGRPVIAPRLDAICRVAEHGRTAFLFERDRLASLAEALATLAAQPALRDRLGREAAATAAQHSWERRAAALLARMAAIAPRPAAAGVKPSRPRP